jgi:predicted transcriptional regulator of viral defense system
MADDVEILRIIERAPLRTMRYAELRGFGSNVWRNIDRLTERGALTRLAHGVYTAPPDGRDGRTWRPTIEAAGLAIATARFGNRNAILMGLGAARHWAAIPRAIGVTTVAVPVAGRPPVELDRGGRVYMIPRKLARIDATVQTTELGPALVTRPAQTIYDLLMKPAQGGMPEEAAAAARNLVGGILPVDLQDVIDANGRANAAVRKLLDEMLREEKRATAAE